MRSRDVVSRKCLVELGAGRGRVGNRAGKRETWGRGGGEERPADGSISFEGRSDEVG